MFAPVLATTAAAGTVVACSTGHLVFSGKIPTVTRTLHQVVSPSVGHFAFTGKIPTVTRTNNQIVLPSVGHLVWSGKVPTVKQELLLTLTVQQAIRLEAVCRLHGLVSNLTVNNTSRSSGPVTQTIGESGGTITVTTTGLPSTSNLTPAMVDNLARLYGLIAPLDVTVITRSDGTLSQTISEVGGTTTVTTQ